MRESFRKITLVDGVFVANGSVFSASGGAATADLMWHLITEKHGEELSLAVSEHVKAVFELEVYAQGLKNGEKTQGCRPDKNQDRVVEVLVPVRSFSNRAQTFHVQKY